MDKAVKQRLLGGVVLVAGAALFLPMLLNGSGVVMTVPPMPEPPAMPAAETVAPALDKQVQQADQAVDAAHAPVPETRAETAPQAQTQVQPQSPGSAAEQTGNAAAPVAAAASASAPAAPKPSAAPDKSDKSAQDKSADKAKVKADAEKAAAKADAKPEAKSEAKPDAVASAAPAVPTAWVVQVASLSTKAKADALTQKLRKKNYHATASQQGSVWKVVVGPELSKEVAESVKSRLTADADLNVSGAWVQAYKP